MCGDKGLKEGALLKSVSVPYPASKIVHENELQRIKESYVAILKVILNEITLNESTGGNNKMKLLLLRAKLVTYDNC